MRKSALALTILLLLSGCSRSPSTTVKDAYTACNAHQYTDAQKYLSKDVVAGMAGLGGVKAFCDMNTDNGSITDIKIINEQINGDSGAVSVEFTYKNGTKSNGYMAPVVKEDGDWKVGAKAGF